MFSVEKKGHYGLGVSLRGRGEDLEVSRSGSNEGFRCTFVYYARRGSGVVVLTNSDAGSTITMQMVHALARYFHWPGYQVNTIEAIDIPPQSCRNTSGAIRPRIFPTKR